MPSLHVFVFFRLGLNGTGKCNHIGGLLFAITDFHEKGLHQQTDKVSCTSKLNGWIVPRNLTVKPKPIADIKVKKIQYGKQTCDRPNVNTFDPRAPQDESLNMYQLNKMYDNLKEHAPNSDFFLYHDPPPDTDVEPHIMDYMESENVGLNISLQDSASEKLLNCASNKLQKGTILPISLVQRNIAIHNSVEVDEAFITKFVEPVIEIESINDSQIECVEKLTKGQSENVTWKKLHKYKASSSNFGKMIKCSKNPDGLLKHVL